MNLYRSICLVVLSVLVFSACTKDDERTGCTDPIASNYDPSALHNDGSCTYESRQEIIFSNGEFWGWQSDTLDGGYIVEVCEGQVDIVEEEPRDSSQVQYLRVRADMQTGNAKFRVRIVNPRDGRPFRNGNVRFDARLPHQDPVPEFLTFIHGKLVDEGTDCGQFIRSDYQGFVPTGLNDSTFAEVELPILSYPKIMLANIEGVYGLEVRNAQPGADVLHLNNIRWTTR